MANAKHTPGPWESKPETPYVPAQVWADGRQLAEVYGESRATRAANASLMAAAPEMKDLLRAAYVQVDEGSPLEQHIRELLRRLEEQ